MLIAIGACVLYTTACVSIGAAVLPMIGMPRSELRAASAAVVLATMLLLGQGVLANIWLALGLASEFSMPVIVALLGLCLVIGTAIMRRDIGTLIRRLWQQGVDHLSELPLVFQPFAVLVLVVVSLLGIFNAILPVRFGAGDGIFFYMVLPKVMAASQRLMPVSGYEYTHSTSGFLGEMHHAALLALSGEEAALLFVWVTTVSMAALLVGLCGYLGLGRVGKWIALAMMLSSTTVTFYLIDGKVDLFAAAMGMAALYWALQGDRDDIRLSATCLAGLFTGFAVVAKATYALGLALPVVALLIWKRKGFTSSPSLWLGFGLVASLPFLLHAAKNFLFFREPFAPFIFLDSEIGAAYRGQGYWNSPDIARKILLTYPFALAYGDYMFQYGNISGLYIALSPLALLLPGRSWHDRDQLKRFTIVVLATVILSAFVQAPYFAPRFSLPALLALIPGLAFATETAFHASVKHLWVPITFVACLCIALIGYSTLEQDFKRVVRYKLYGSGICDLEGFPLLECHDMMALNEVAALGDRIFTRNSYSYWLRPDLIQCLPSRDERHVLSSSIGNVERLYDLGFHYVENTGEPWNLSHVPGWLSVSPVYSREAVGLSGALQIYEIRSNDVTQQPRLACRQVNPPAWEVAARPPHTELEPR